MGSFVKLVCAPAGVPGVGIAIAASRAGGVGVVNAEFRTDVAGILADLDATSRLARKPYGLRVDHLGEGLAQAILDRTERGLRWLLVDAGRVAEYADVIAAFRAVGGTVLASIVDAAQVGGPLEEQVDGLIVKGGESGGFVGEDSSFILLQRCLKLTGLPLYLHGGLTPQVAASLSAAGVAGGLFDSQILLLDDSPLPPATRSLLANLSGNETIAVGDGERGQYFRILLRPGHGVAKTFAADGDGLGFEALRALAEGRIDWSEPRRGIVPLGQDICFAGAWARRYRTFAALFQAVDEAIDRSLEVAVAARATRAGAPLAEALGISYPIVQGPMTRVSDSASFAAAVADGGALPMIAFALLKGRALQELLDDTQAQLGGRPWGIGLLGFAPQTLLDEQLSIATQYKPRYAIIAGGRPDQAVRLEASGISTFLHVPSANLIPMFVQEGARRFIFEGRECGGHVGPLSSFVLWSTMVDRVLEELATGKVRGEELQLLFAGGIHDALSSAMVQVLFAPLVAAGVRCGILMGSAYLFTREIVAAGAIVPTFQQEVIGCERTVNLESGPGHASRCAYTPFAEEFFRERARLKRENVPADEGRAVLDDLIMGRLRIASKGRWRGGADGAMEELDEARQRAEGMYMLGQVATLRAEVTEVPALHRQVSDEAIALLESRLAERPVAMMPEGTPVDIAIVGIASVLPGSSTTADYWENILDKVDSITEIPRHRWDWRLYFDEDRNARDKIYSKWGGFLDDLPFDPTRYGMPPKSIESVDPMQLMALEVAQRTLADAGYDEKPFDRTRASVIIGASGGAGDVGMQYGVRSELPRFNGELPAEVGERLPEWTEDSFAGILINVVAGRIANRLNFGGVNFTTDAACASSLTAVYQGVSELVAGRSDLVVAGGIDTVQGPFGYLCFSKTQALSPRGRCSSFDASGDGIVISEGIAMVALKRLADAERDGDRIYAVIKGAGGSSDGNAKGMTAPLPAGQLRAMRRAYQQAGFGPSSVGLFEAHGTGTVAGDTAELESTTSLLRAEGATPRQCAIGSVKTMIGHTKATAGVAGLVKAALALHHRVLPPHRGVSQPNKVLAQADAPLYLVDQALPWIAEGNTPRRAACSAFGFGGTNFHVVLEEYADEYRERMRPMAKQRWQAELMLFSGESREVLSEKLLSLRRQLPDAAALELRDLSASLARVWRPEQETLAIVARDLEDLTVKLAHALALLRGEEPATPAGVYHREAAVQPGKVAVLFPGQGSQYPGMGRELSLSFPRYAATLEAADKALGEAFTSRFGAPLNRFLFPRGAYDDAARTAAREALTRTDIAQPALGAVESAMYELMREFGLSADMFAGHSYGEFVAHWAGGAIDFVTLMELSAARGRFIVDAVRAADADLGTMAAVQGERAAIEAALSGTPEVIVANHNAPQQSIISGPREQVRSACAQLEGAGFAVTPIPVAAAFHSRQVEPAQRALSELIDRLPWQQASLPVYSNTTARPHAADIAATRRLMAEHLVRPVEFVAEIEQMYADGARCFVEVGPKSVLSRLVGQTLQGRPHVAVSIDGGNGVQGLLDALARLIVAGVALDVAPLFASRDCRIADPQRLETLDRRPPLSRHAWMLNGSGARRASAPVRQIGVTQEQLQPAVAAQAPAVPHPTVAVMPPRTPAARSAPQPQPQPAVGRPLPPTPGPLAPATAATTNFDLLSSSRRRMEYPMDNPRSAPAASAQSDVAADYFETMRQFLQTQERVMAMLVGDATGPAVPRLPRAMPSLSLARSNAPAAAPAASVVAMPAPAPVPQPAAAVNIPEPMPAAPQPVTAPAGAARAATPAAAAPAAAAPATPVAAAVAVPEPVRVAAPAAAEGLDRARMTEMLLAIVEDKTGYPRDMVGLDQNLESDLGIDSIKRIEIVGTMLQKLPESFRASIGDNRAKLNTQPTLDGMLTMLCSLQPAGEALPFEVAGAGSLTEETGHPPRHVVAAREQPLPANAARALQVGRFVMSEDALGISSQLASLLKARGCAVVSVPTALLADEPALRGWIEAQRGEGPVSGLVHLAPIGRPRLASDAALSKVSEALRAHEKALFTLLHDLGDGLSASGHVLAASGLGGYFGREPAVIDGVQLQGGSVGMLKSLLEERPQLRVRAVDVDPGCSAADIAAQLLAELELVGGRQEVGYPAGRRTIFQTLEIAPEIAADAEQRLQSLVVLATGGARGITAEVLRELARPGNTLVLTGRGALPEPEAPATAALTSAEQLRAYLIAETRAGRMQLKPAEIARRIQAILAAREMHANIADFRAGGADVVYEAVDVTDETAMSRLISGLYERYGRIDGVVHGAGIIEDKLLADKTSESWSRVVDTKILGLWLLQKHLRPESLKFLSVFSSVAGRYGNSGQSDYATANELMNRICCQLADRWGGKVNVSALCWGPWGATRFGAGMVTEETEAKFSSRGVRLVTAATGRRLFREALTRADFRPVELVCGAGPWERVEAERGLIHYAEERPLGEVLGPLIGAAEVTATPKGERELRFRIDRNHLFLDQHRIDDVMILPAAAALELIAEAARSQWPGWQVIEVRDLRLIKGVELGSDLDGLAHELIVRINPPPYGSSEGFEVTANLQSGGERPRNHYRATVRLEQQLATATEPVPLPRLDRKLSVAKAYDEWLFHGPCFQVITQIEGLSSQGAVAQLRSSRPAEWMRTVAPGHGHWTFDPALLDAAAQMALLWARGERDESCLPIRFGRVARHREQLPERLQMVFETLPGGDTNMVRANVSFVDSAGQVVLQVEELECIGSAALNRLGGTARAEVRKTA